MSYQIDKNVPVPPEAEAGKRLKYPFSRMDVGDSFFVKADKKGINSVRTTAHAFGERHNRKFSTRMENEGVRCWRIA